MVSYDTVEVARRKADWINQQGLGGGMYWELSGDHPTGNPQSIVSSVNKSFGKDADRSPNHLTYPSSKWDNLKKGMQ